MANQVAARLAGDDYQHLLAWLRILDLLIPSYKIHSVSVEDAEAMFVDDVTTRHDVGARRPDEFWQVKYHVDQRDQYSTEALFLRKSKSRKSLLEKLYVTWRSLTQDSPDRPVELRLISNWTWDAADPVAACIQGTDNALGSIFFFGIAHDDYRKST